MDTKQQIDRLRVLWKSGRDKYTSFFTVLNEVRAEIGDAALADWCREELWISLSIILDASKLLKKIDADLVKAQYNAARQVEKQQRAAEAHERELKRLQRVREVAEVKAEAAKKAAAAKAEADRVVAEIKAEEARFKAELRKVKAIENKRQHDRENPNKKGPKANARRRRQEYVMDLEKIDPVLLAKRYKKADKMCQESTERWIEGSIAKALVLCEARNRYPVDQDFGMWLEKNSIDLSKDDRTALIGLGKLGVKRMQEILTATDRHSYQWIWREQKPDLKIVQ